MAWTFKGPLSGFRKEAERQVRERLEPVILQTLKYLGEKCVAHARSLNTYRDQTGNLRSSIGYVVLKDGQIMFRSFQRNYTKKTGETRRKRNYGKSGVVAGEELAERLAAKHPTGYVLIVVAGMNYALSVESRGKDVLTSAEQLAKTELPRLMTQLNRKAKALRKR